MRDKTLIQLNDDALITDEELAQELAEIESEFSEFFASEEFSDEIARQYAS
jgi:hypothetical protein